MTHEINEIGIHAAGGHGPGMVVLAPDVCIGKNGIHSWEADGVAYTNGEIDRRLAAVAGTLLHGLFAKACSRRWTGDEFFGESTVDSMVKALAVSNYQQGICFTVKTNMDKVDLELPSIKRIVSTDIDAHLRERWDTIERFAFAFLEGIYGHPYLNKPNYIIAPEVRLPAQTKHLKLLGRVIETREISVSLRFDSEEEGSRVSVNVVDVLSEGVNPERDSETPLTMGDFLYGMLIRRAPVTHYFPGVSKIVEDYMGVSLDNILKGDADEYGLMISELQSNGRITQEQFNTLIALRFFSHVAQEAGYLIGEKAGMNKGVAGNGDRVSFSMIRDNEELLQIIRQVVGSVEGSKVDEDWVDGVAPGVYDVLPETQVDWRQPANIRPDALVFIMPEQMNEKQAAFMREFNGYLSQQYDKKKHPPLLVQGDFYRMLDKGVELGLRIRAVDLKTNISGKTADGMSSYYGEIYHYLINMAQGLWAFRCNQVEGRNLSVRDLLNDPILKAFDGFDILSVSMASGGKRVRALFQQFSKDYLFSGLTARSRGVFKRHAKALRRLAKSIMVARGLQQAAV